MTLSSGSHLGTFLSEVCPKSNPPFMHRAYKKLNPNKVALEPEGCSSLIKKIKEVTSANFISSIVLIGVGFFLLILLLFGLFIKLDGKEKNV
jgi:hypothetical protein